MIRAGLARLAGLSRRQLPAVVTSPAPRAYGPGRLPSPLRAYEPGRLPSPPRSYEPGRLPSPAPLHLLGRFTVSAAFRPPRQVSGDLPPAHLRQIQRFFSAGGKNASDFADPAKSYILEEHMSMVKALASFCTPPVEEHILLAKELSAAAKSLEADMRLMTNMGLCLTVVLIAAVLYLPMVMSSLSRDHNAMEVKLSKLNAELFSAQEQLQRHKRDTGLLKERVNELLVKMPPPTPPL